jgi:uncharacterized protein (TIGR03435 family)
MPLRKRYYPLLLTLYAAAHGQVQPITFEVASVKISPPFDRTKPPMNGCSGGPGTSDPGLYQCHYLTLQALVIEAFGLAPYQLPYVPSGDHTTYDIEAKVPAGTTREQLRGMLQNLLVERLKLAYHFEKKPAQAYDLAVAKNGPKLHESPPESAEKPQAADNPASDEYGFRIPPADFKGQLMLRNSEIVRWLARGVTVAQMARLLAGRLQGPVTDSTGLDGKYDFTLYCSAVSVGLSSGPDPAGPAPAGVAKKVGEESAEGVFVPSIFVVLREKLGLTLEKKQVLLDLFVVDHVERVPVEN